MTGTQAQELLRRFGAGSSREAAVLGLFFLATFQAATQFPYLVLAPGFRENLFTGALCAAPLLAALALGLHRAIRITWWEKAISLAVAVLPLVSGALSATPVADTFRSFVFVSPVLSGFWCARLLFNTSERRRLLVWFLVCLSGVVLILSLASFLFMGQAWRLLEANPHAYLSRLIALCAGPLALALQPDRRRRLLGLGLLSMLGLAMLQCPLKTALLIPVALAALALRFIAGRRARWLLAAAMMLFVAGGLLGGIQHRFAALTPENNTLSYRLESFPFAWHIATGHPWLGIGLRSPRDTGLADYEISHAAHGRERFADSVKRLVTQENSYLTLLTGLGIPFTALYLACLLGLLAMGWRGMAREGRPAALPALAVMLPLGGLLLHLLAYDGLLSPQVAWFVHVLLGLIPSARAAAPPVRGD